MQNSLFAFCRAWCRCGIFWVYVQLQVPIFWVCITCVNFAVNVGVAFFCATWVSQRPPFFVGLSGTFCIVWRRGLRFNLHTNNLTRTSNKFSDPIILSERYNRILLNEFYLHLHTPERIKELEAGSISPKHMLNKIFGEYLDLVCAFVFQNGAWNRRWVCVLILMIKIAVCLLSFRSRQRSALLVFWASISRDGGLRVTDYIQTNRGRITAIRGKGKEKDRLQKEWQRRELQTLCEMHEFASLFFSNSWSFSILTLSASCPNCNYLS